jgi:hypothetical protein
MIVNWIFFLLLMGYRLKTSLVEEAAELLALEGYA